MRGSFWQAAKTDPTIVICANQTNPAVYRPSFPLMTPRDRTIPDERTQERCTPGAESQLSSSCAAAAFPMYRNLPVPRQIGVCFQPIRTGSKWRLDKMSSHRYDYYPPLLVNCDPLQHIIYNWPHARVTCTGVIPGNRTATNWTAHDHPRRKRPVTLN